MVHKQPQVNKCSYAIHFSYRCNVQFSSHSYLLIDLSVQPISLHKDNFLWYHSTTSTLIFPDILTKMSVKTYSLFVRKKQTCLWQRRMRMIYELWILFLWFCYFMKHLLWALFLHISLGLILFRVFSWQWGKGQKGGNNAVSEISLSLFWRKHIFQLLLLQKRDQVYDLFPLQLSLVMEK